MLQFRGGQSNPTYLLESGGKKYVLRKKPPGKLLKSAHAVEREYRIYRALEDTAGCRAIRIRPVAAGTVTQAARTTRSARAGGARALEDTAR